MKQLRVPLDHLQGVVDLVIQRDRHGETAFIRSVADAGRCLMSAIAFRP